MLIDSDMLQLRLGSRLTSFWGMANLGLPKEVVSMLQKLIGVVTLIFGFWLILELVTILFR